MLKVIKLVGSIPLVEYFLYLGTVTCEYILKYTAIYGIHIMDTYFTYYSRRYAKSLQIILLYGLRNNSQK